MDRRKHAGIIVIVLCVTGMGLKEIVLKIKLTNDKIAHLWAVFDVMTFLEAQMTQV